MGIYVSLPAVWRPRSGRCAGWGIFALEEHSFYGHYTLNEVLRRIVYSCNLLFDGIDPDQPDQLLANGRKFVRTELIGDWAWQKWIQMVHAFWFQLAKVGSSLLSLQSKGPK